MARDQLEQLQAQIGTGVGDLVAEGGNAGSAAPPASPTTASATSFFLDRSSPDEAPRPIGPGGFVVCAAGGHRSPRVGEDTETGKSRPRPDRRSPRLRGDVGGRHQGGV